MNYASINKLKVQTTKTFYSSLFFLKAFMLIVFFLRWEEKSNMNGDIL